MAVLGNSQAQKTTSGNVVWAKTKVKGLDPNIMNMLHCYMSLPSYKFPQGEVCGFCCFLYSIPGLLGQTFQ